jgi:uncharacterized protein (TIGR00730 family)
MHFVFDVAKRVSRANGTLSGIKRPFMTGISSICVYCGSGPGNDPAYLEAAARLGKSLADHKIALVYGGANVGLMGMVARSVLEHGGYVTGIIPEFLKNRELMLDSIQETITVDDMHTRKRLMFERADAFIALPGGIGTLEELVEQMTWAQLGQHKKPILLLDVKEFWQPLLTLLAHMRQAHFIRDGLEVNYMVTEKPEEAVPILLDSLSRQAPASPTPLIARM